MSTQQALEPEQLERAQNPRKPEQNYELRVIHGTGGLLELVEIQPRKHQWFHDWVRAMQFAHWNF